MTNPMVVIHNTETNEIIEREMNADELAQLEKDKAQSKIQNQAETAKVAEKQAILDQLGITAEQAKLLLS